MHLLGANQQKAYLFKVLDKSLRQYVRNSCAPYGNTPILTFSQNNKTCLMDFIDQHFESSQPLHIRRAELSQYKKHKKQSNSQYVAAYLQMANDAELPTTAIDNIIAVQAVAGMDESEIRTNLLMDVNLGTVGLVRKIEAWESARLKDKNAGNTWTSSGFAGSTKTTKGSNKSSSKTPDNQCHRCPVPGHDEADCYWKTNNCSYCKKQGHDVNVCKTKKRKEGQSGNSEQTSTQTKKKGKANAAAAAQEESDTKTAVSNAVSAHCGNVDLRSVVL